MKDWYQYRPWNLTYRAQWRESRHMTNHKTGILWIAAAPWWMVYLWTTGFCSVYAPNILFSISHIKSLQWCPGEKIKFLYISMYCTTTYQLRPIGEWPISVFQVSVCSTYFTAALLPHNANNSSYVDPYFVWRNILLLRYSCLFIYKHDFGNSKFSLWSSINQI